MLHSNFTLWRHGAALLVLAGTAVAAIPCGRASAQEAAVGFAEPAELAEPAEPAEPLEPSELAELAAPLPPAAPALTALPPAPPAAPTPPKPPKHVAGTHRLVTSSNITLLSDDRRNASVLFEKGDTNMYGSSDDLREARRARRGEETLWWIRKDGKRYVVRDADTIQQLKAAYAPVEALGRQQGELGERQGRLGERQGELGEQQGAIAQRQAGLAAEQARAASGGQAAPGPAARTDAAQADVAQQMEALAKRQSALAEQQEGFARQQAALAQRQQVANAALQRDIERIVQQAIARGVAQPLPQ